MEKVRFKGLLRPVWFKLNNSLEYTRKPPMDAVTRLLAWIPAENIN